MAIIDFFDRGWRQDPSGPALTMDDRTWSFDSVYAESCRIAHALRAEGGRTETAAAVLSPNDATAWICVLGIWRAGLAWVPLNPGYAPAETRALIHSLDCEFLFFHESLADVVLELVPDLPKVHTYVSFGDAAQGRGPGVRLTDWLEGMPSSPPGVEHSPNDVVAIASTGGTTGVPKGVMNTHRSLSITMAHLMLAMHYPADAPIVNLVAAPMTHAAGVISLAASARGGNVVIVPRPEPSLLLDAITRYKATELFLPPTVIYRLLEHLGDRPHDLSSLRYLIYGAAPMSTEKLRRALEVLGPVMLECYGQVEAFTGIAFMRPEEHYVDGRVADDDRLGSCGRPAPLIELEIRDASGAAVPRGESGEICVRGDLVMRGYYKDPSKTSETVRNGWLHTGDIGHLDGQGFLHITDRSKDMIVSGGFNIYPSQVEQVLWSHPDVQDCAVVGVPDDDWGEAVKAVVEVVPGSSVTEDELIAMCKSRIGSIKTPKSVDFVGSLPRSPNGKVLRRAVRDSYWRGSGRRV